MLYLDTGPYNWLTNEFSWKNHSDRVKNQRYLTTSMKDHHSAVYYDYRKCACHIVVGLLALFCYLARLLDSPITLRIGGQSKAT